MHGYAVRAGSLLFYAHAEFLSLFFKKVYLDIACGGAGD